MSKTAARLAALSVALALMACVREPFAPPQYAHPAPPPLLPYVEPAVPAAAAEPAPEPAQPVVQRRNAKKRAPRVNCRCLPVP